MEAVSSEIHQDLLFLDSIGGDVFGDQDGREEEEEAKAGQDEDRVTTVFTATAPNDEAVDIRIDHFRTSTVSLVGRQVWRGALLLADLLLARPELVRGRRVAELAAGTGLTSAVACRVPARSVLSTDVDRGGILELLESNLSVNAVPGSGSYKVAEIDFFSSAWKDDLSEDLPGVEVLLAADVVYDPEITEAFFSTLRHLMSHDDAGGGDNGPCPALSDVLLAVEERRRAGAGGRVEAPNFRHFARLLSDLAEDSAAAGWALEELPAAGLHQSFQCYDRVKELRLWRLRRRREA